MNRRHFLTSAALVTTAMAVAPATLKAESTTFTPTEVLNLATNEFEPLAGGLRSIKRGQLFRRVTDGRHIPGTMDGLLIVDGSVGWYAVAADDGFEMTKDDGAKDGAVECFYYEDFGAALARAREL